MKKGQEISLGYKHAHVYPSTCICVSMHAFGNGFVSSCLFVCFYLLVSVGVMCMFTATGEIHDQTNMRQEVQTASLSSMHKYCTITERSSV